MKRRRSARQRIAGVETPVINSGQLPPQGSRKRGSPKDTKKEKRDTPNIGRKELKKKRRAVQSRKKMACTLG